MKIRFCSKSMVDIKNETWKHISIHDIYYATKMSRPITSSKDLKHNKTFHWICCALKVRSKDIVNFYNALKMIDFKNINVKTGIEIDLVDNVL